MSDQERETTARHLQTALTLGALSIALGLPGSAQADCVQTGTDVTCSGLARIGNSKALFGSDK